MTQARAQFISHCELIRKALWSSIVAGPGVDVLPAHGASILVGAGMSRNAVIDTAKYGKPPTWTEISRRLVEPLAPGDSLRQRRLLEQTGAVSGFLRLAQMYQARFGRAQLDRFIEENVNNDAMSPGHLHRLLLQIPWTNVFTTNWDTLLETAAKSERLRRYDLVTKPEDLPKTTGARIFKLHGTVYSSKHLIFTEEDFRTYPTRFAPFVNTVQQAMMETVFVLIGFSGEDPNFLQWTGWVRDRLGDYTPRLYLVGDHSQADFSSEMLQLNKVVPLDLGQISDAELRAADLQPNQLAHRIEWWFRYLLAGEELPLTVWPRGLYNYETSPRAKREKRFVPPEFQPLDPGQGNGQDADTFFSTAIFGKDANPALLQTLCDELREVRCEFRNWIAAPPDARDDVFEGTFKQWQTKLSSGLATSNRPRDLRLSRILRRCMRALQEEDFAAAIKAEIEESYLDKVPEGFSRDQNVGTWIGNELPDQAFAFLCEYIWLCDTIQQHWPDGTLDLMISILERRQALGAGAADHFAVKSLLAEDGDTADLRRRLAIALLRQCRQQAVDADTFAKVRRIALKEMESEHEFEADRREVQLIEALWYADHGAFDRVNEVLRRIAHKTPTTPQDLRASLRLAALLDEFGATELDCEKARDLRAEAFIEIRDQAGPVLRDFELASCESWVLAMANTRMFNHFIDEAANRLGVGREELRMSVRPRLDELVAFRCDPRREIRRAERNIRSQTNRRQAAVVLDQAGYPLATQIVRGKEKLYARHTLSGFAWKAISQELSAAENMISDTSDKMDGKQFGRLDYAVSFALRFLFRMLSHPNQNDFYGSRVSVQHDINAEIVPAIIKIGAKLLRGIKPEGPGGNEPETDPPSDAAAKNGAGECRLEIKCIRFCLDVLTYELGRLRMATPSTGERYNAVRLALIVLGALTREARLEQSIKSETRTAPWSRDLAYQAVDVLARLIATVRLQTLGETPEKFNEDWTFLVEDMLKLALGQALRIEGQATQIFTTLWGHFPEGNQTNPRIEPFRLIYDNRNTPGQPDIRDMFETALGSLQDDTAPQKAAGLIRFLDAARDWGFVPDDDKARDLKIKIIANYGRGETGRADLDPWEWLMVDEVHKKAIVAFRKAFFDDGLKPGFADPKQLAATRSKTENLHGALEQTRVKFKPEPEELREALAWVNAVIDTCREEKKFDQLHDLPKLTKIFTRIMDEAHRKTLAEEDFDLLFETLNNLLSVNAPVEMMVPELASHYPRQLRESGNYHKLGGLLRRGLAMIHYPEQQDQFSRSIDATKEWISRAEIKPGGKSAGLGAPPPPPALLGALGQALARPRLNRGKRVLETIASFLDFHAPGAAAARQAESMDLSDILVDLRHRIDGMLQGWEEDTSPDLCNVSEALAEIERVVAKIQERGDGGGLSVNEMNRLRAGLAALQDLHGPRPEPGRRSA